MVKKQDKTDDANNDADGPRPSGSVRDSAQHIWQAGLGALARAQAEGTRAFEALVKEGSTLQRKSQTTAEEKISEATSKMSDMANGISSRASGHWDKLETIFEERVAKALNKLGVPSAKDVGALMARMDELDQSVQKISAASARPVPAAKKRVSPKAALKPAIKKPAGKKPAAKKRAAAVAAKPAVTRKPVPKKS